MYQMMYARELKLRSALGYEMTNATSNQSIGANKNFDR